MAAVRSQGGTVTGDELRRIRHELGLSGSKFGRALGYGGADTSIQPQISKLENDKRPVPISVARLAFMYWRFGVPEEFLR